jgi:hypothetical protein
VIIFGTRGYLSTVVMLTFICNNCHNPAAQRVVHRVIRFTLFFIPLFPVSSTYSTTCTFCGYGSKITKEQAHEYAAPGAAQYAAYRHQPLPEQIASPQYGQPVHPSHGPHHPQG